ncbi:hypothetical protein Q7P37_004977 [Cladosporium fusiforme]
MDESQREEASLPIGGDQPAQPPVSNLEAKEPTPVNDNDDAKATTKEGDEQPKQPQSNVLQALTDRTLHFLAHASNETLGACLVGLGASTYFVFGRVGLVFIGVAGGVVLHATWDGIRNDDRDESVERLEQQRKKETGLDLARRLLDLRLSAETAQDEREEAKLNANHQLDFSRFEPETAAALDTFANAVIKDYVHYWYDPTLPGEEAFPESCKHTLVAFMLSLSGHLERKRPADAFLDFVTNTSSLIIVFLNELATALNASPTVPADEAIAMYLHLKPDSSLAHVLDKKHQDHRLNMVADDILKAYLDPKAYAFPPTHLFLKEVLSQLVLKSTIGLCSRPEWINEWIVYGLETSETTKSVMDMVDAGVEGRSDTKQPQSNPNRKDPTTPAQKVGSRKEGNNRGQTSEHRRNMSRAEEAMDDAMKEARRLTQLMIDEDRRRAQEEADHPTPAALTASGELSDSVTSHGAPTPTSSDSDRDRQEAEVSAWTGDSAVDQVKIAEQNAGAISPSEKPFTNFDQLLPTQEPATLVAERAETPRVEAPQITLHNAIISLFDDSVPGEKTTMKSKPAVDYLIQVEPANSASPGWMIARKFADFEVLHEVLRRISVITGAQFTDTNPELPKWRGNTKAALREDLERYLQNAMRYQSLAESEGMKRFLEKEQAMSKSPGERGKFGWPTPDAFGKLGGNVIDALAKAPKDVAGGVAGGGKAFFGGVAGLVGGKKGIPSQASPSRGSLSRSSTSTPPVGMQRSNSSTTQSISSESSWVHTSATRQSHDSLSSFPTAALERKNSSATTTDTEAKADDPVSPISSSVDLSSRPPSFVPGQFSPPTPPTEPTAAIDEAFVLPPPPSDISDDYGSPAQIARLSTDTRRSKLDQTMTAPSEEGPISPPRPKPAAKPEKQRKPPLSEQETAVAVELMFAVVNELYTLSSAWQIRRTLLAAAKTYLLRPGNPQLEDIRQLLQKSTLDNNLSDSGVAGHIYKLRENALPTEEETKAWERDNPEKTEVEKDELQKLARELLVTKGMPAAMSSVMGAAASSEALGRVFDCLQLPEVSRGLMFGLMLQALKVVTH